MSLIIGINAMNSFSDTANNTPIINNGDVLSGQKDMFGGNNAFYFNGSNYLQITDSILDLGTNDFTIAFWANLKLEDNYNKDWRAFFGNYVSNSMTLWAYGGSGARYSLSINASDNNRNDSYIIDGTWHHYALVRQKSEIKLYIDGVCRTAWIIAETQIINFQHDIGIGYALSYNAIVGYMSDFIIDNTALWTDDFTVPTKYMVKTASSLYIGKNNTVYGSKLSLEE